MPQQPIARRTRRISLTAVAALAAVAVTATGCGSNGSQVAAAPVASTPPTINVKVVQPSSPRVHAHRRTVVQTATPVVVAPAVAPATYAPAASICGAGLTSGPNTSCPFAANVRATFETHGPGTMMVFSPVTGRTYAMTCSAGSPVVCTGGDHAYVSFA